MSVSEAGAIAAPRERVRFSALRHIGFGVLALCGCVATVGAAPRGEALTPAPAAGVFGSVVVPDPDSGVDYTADIDRGWFDLQLSGLPALPSARFLTSRVALVQATAETLEATASIDAEPRMHQELSTTLFATDPDGVLQQRIVAELRGQVADNVLLQVQDEAGTILCEAQGGGAVPARCDITVPLPRPESFSRTHAFHVYAANTDSALRPDELRLESFVGGSEYSAVNSGPGQVAAGETFLVRMTHNLRTTAVGQALAGFLRVYSAPEQLVREIPFRYRWNGDTQAGVNSLLYLDGPNGNSLNETGMSFVDRVIQDRFLVDVPVNATAVTFTARRIFFGSSQSQPPLDVDLYLMPFDGDPVVSRIVPASIADAPFSATSEDSTAFSSESITLAAPDLRPGRWYVIPVSKTGERMDFAARARFDSFGPAPAFQSGHYYNPSRSGHGVFVDFAGDQWVMVWYTYLEDGTPTWYYAQGAAPTEVVGRSIWQPTLYRVVWDGEASFAYQAGWATVTLLGEDSFQFSYSINGESGSERLVRLGGGGCPLYAGQSFDGTGHWYSPSKSGFGYSSQFEPATEVHAAYLYDDHGYPRWLIGQKDYAPGVENVPLLQLQGFCPTCEYAAPSNQTVGTLTRALGIQAAPDNLPGLLNMAVNVTLKPPLNGSWSENLPVGLLSARKQCR